MLEQSVAVHPAEYRRLIFDIVQSFEDTGTMETIHAAERLAALGHETRLEIFRLLVQAGPDGVKAGLIGEALGIPSTTLSFHLAHLGRVGLISGRQESRFIFYAADFSAMDDLIAFLTDNCCHGKACLPKTAAASNTAKRCRSPAKTS
jgi:ArsR family transcriptional regulator